MKKIFAFTMAEVLIALSIVAVLGSLTIPAVISNNKKQTMLVLLKKTYAELNQNLHLFSTSNYRGLFNSSLSLGSYSVPDQTDPTITNLETTRTIEQTACRFLTSYYASTLDNDKFCGTTAQPCFASKYYSHSRTIDNFNCSNGCSALLKSGTAICIIPADVSHSGGNRNGHYINPVADNTPAVVYIDLNGPDKPNTGGKDMFNFRIYGDYTVDEIEPSIARSSASKTVRENLFKNNCKSSSVGTGCFSKIILDNWKIKY